ncbi:response regulator [Cohnella hongkongensis]|uniref:Response regulator n=1 Tax=Cohnella hongkongensis TaxID=178337 RepID=A0ABV9FEA4_9BACL
MKLLVADDEALIRDGIRSHIDWGGYGIEIAGVEENGLAALRVLEREPIDILVTDIRMPRMDGIELSREARKRYPNIKIIILSGYEEFEFAQQALELSVMKYLLKPFTRPELEEAVVQAKEEVESMRRAERQMSVTMERLRSSLPLLRDRYLNDWISGRLSAGEIPGRLQSVDLEPGPARYAVTVTAIDGAEQGIPLADGGGSRTDLLSLLLLEEVAGELKESGTGVAFQGRGGETIAVLSGLQHSNELYAFAEAIREKARSIFGLTVSVCLGGLKEDLAEVASSYREALEAMDYRFLVGKDSVVPYDLIHFQSQGAWEGISGEHAGRLVAAIRAGREEQAREELERLFEALRNLQGAGHSDVKSHVTEFVAASLTQLIVSGSRLKEIYGKEYNPYAVILAAKTIDELKQELETMFVDLSRYILDKRGDRKRRVIEEAVEYIQANYSREDLSFNGLSERLGMNPTYFSKLFKQETGSTFTDYVTKVRLDQAKRALRETTLRVSEIAYGAGFRDPFYFSTLFKKHTGLNPTEYRDLR